MPIPGRVPLLFVVFLLTTSCRRERPPPLSAEDPLPALDATLIEPVGPAGRFERCEFEFRASGGDLVVRALAGKDEVNALITIRDWLRREFGSAIDDLDLVTLRLTRFSPTRGGLLLLRQTYRGIETPGGVFLISSGRSATVSVYL